MSRTLKYVLTFLLLLIPFIAFAPDARTVEGETVYIGTNTNIYGDDSHSEGRLGPHPIGFNFNFYGQEFGEVNVNINGALAFSDTYYTTYSNQQLHQETAQDFAIFPFWDDITSYPQNNSAIYYATIGEAPNRMFIMQWTNMYFFNTEIQMGTFQAILYEGSNDVQIQYRDLLGGERALGNSATIGIRKNASTYQQYSYNTASLTQGQAIRYTFNGVDNYSVNTNAEYEPVYLLPEGAPASPELVNPTDGTTGITTTPAFEWLPVEGAASYVVLISTQSNFSSTVVNQSGITDTSYTHASALSENTQYYWRVQAVNEVGSSLSSTRTFTTGTDNHNPFKPPIVGARLQLISGETLNSLESTGLTVVLNDLDEGQELRYRLQIATDDSFNSLVLDYRSPFGEQGGATYNYGEDLGTYLVGSSDTELEYGDYYLRIRAEDDAAGSSEWSEIEGIAFSYIAETDPPNLSEITVEATDSAAVISWITDENASSQVEYGLVSTYGNMTSKTNTETGVTEHERVLSDLKPCARYFFVTHSEDASGNASTSEPQQFVTSGCAASAISSGTESVVPSSGGTVSLDNDLVSVQLNLPNNFYSRNVNIQVNLLDTDDRPDPPASQDLAGKNFFDLLAVDDEGELVEDFDEAVTIVIAYDEEIEELFKESTLDLYKYLDGEWVALSCDLDMTNNTLTCSLSGFSVYGVFGEPQNSAAATSQTKKKSSSTASAPRCDLQKPAIAPDLFQIDVSDSQATLYIAPAGNPVTEYAIIYGFEQEDERFGVMFAHGESSGVIPYEINHLDVDTTYYFKVRAFNDCMPSDWSNEMKVTTTKSANHSETSYFRNFLAQVRRILPSSAR